MGNLRDLGGEGKNGCRVCPCKVYHIVGLVLMFMVFLPWVSCLFKSCLFRICTGRICRSEFVSGFRFSVDSWSVKGLSVGGCGGYTDIKRETMVTARESEREIYTNRQIEN